MEKIDLSAILFTMQNEKRKFYRHPIRIPIQLIREANQATNSRCENLSQGGLCFYWPDFIPLGTHLQLAIPVEKQLFKMSACVVHSQKDEALGLFRTGVHFKDATSLFRAKLVEEVISIRDYREKISLLRGREFSEEEAAAQWIARNAEHFSKFQD